MRQRLMSHIDAAGHKATDFLDRMAHVETFGALVFMLTLACSLWAFAWYAHIIGPWVDNLMGWGPHDIPTEGQIRWRRMWSTAICLPGIIASIGLYIRNVCNRNR